MRGFGLSFVCVLLLAQLSLAQSKPSPHPPVSVTESGKLPVKRVVLYKNGIGYFEHLGRIHGNQDVSISFTTRQLDDVLKSLALLDLGGGKITAVHYNSVAPLGQQLSNLHLPLPTNPSLFDLLSALRGTRLRVQSGAHSAEGRLLSVEAKTQTHNDNSEQVIVVSLVSAAGDITNFEVQPATTTLHILEPELNQEVTRYLRLVGADNRNDQRLMTISTRGQGDRDLFVSYVSEMPVWKSTYRIILPAKDAEKPLLQGWAIVDNAGGEDWNNVELSLVAGAPQSFVQQISQPYYVRRPVVPIPSALQVTPQTHEGALESAAPAPPPPPPSAGPIAGGVLGGVINGLGAGTGGGVGAGAGTGAGVGGPRFTTRSGTNSSSAPMNGRPFDRLQTFTAENMAGSMEMSSVGREAGNVFVYDIKDKVNIEKNQSALVPIVQANIEAEKVSVWNQSMPYPLYALWITNTSGNSLDGGSFHVIDGGTFAGEGIVDSIEPGEKRLLSYAVDVGLRISDKQETSPQWIKRIRVTRGTMIETVELHTTRKYTLRNEDTKPRTLVLEHRIRNGWKLSKDTPEPAETSKEFYRFRVVLPPKESKDLSVSESQPVQSSYKIADLDEDFFENLQHRATMSAQMQQEFRRVLDQKKKLQSVQDEIDARKSELQAIHQDQQRLRENMKALKGSAEEKRLVERYTGELNQQEDRIQAVRSEITNLEKEHAQAQSALDSLIESMSFDVKL